MSTYFYLDDNNQQQGPLTVSQLASTGLKPETLVWTEGMGDWAPAEKVEELGNLMRKSSVSINSLAPPTTPPTPSNIDFPVCPVCRKTFAAGKKFCTEDGAQLVTPEDLIPRCSRCRKKYADGTKFCSDCGGSVRVAGAYQSQSANEIMQTVTHAASNLTGNMQFNSSFSVGVLAGAIGVVLFSMLNWIKISVFGFNIQSTLFGIVGKLNHRELRYYLDASEAFTIIRIVSVLLIIAMLLSYALLAISLFMKPQSQMKPTLAYSGFGLSAIVASIFILAMMYISAELDYWVLTPFPFLTLAVAIASMIFAVKRPTKEDFLSAARGIQQRGHAAAAYNANFHSQNSGNLANMDGLKERHGCVTAWLIFGIIVYSFVALFFMFSSDFVRAIYPQSISNSMLVLLVILNVCSVVFYVMLLQWKKIGFWCMIAIAIISCIINMNTGMGIGMSLLGVIISVGIFYGILQIKKNNKSAWDNLE